jgi:hypothetical protein
MKSTLATSILLFTLGAAGCGGQTEGDDPAGTASLEQGLQAPTQCTISTWNGHYLTALSGGGHATDPLHSDATQVGTWERFTLVDAGLGTSPLTYGIRTYFSYYLTANNGGGKITDVMRSNATTIQGWEQFKLWSQGNGWYAIQTLNGNYLTAVDGGGRTTDVIHSNATQIGNWEKFFFHCDFFGTGL